MLNTILSALRNLQFGAIRHLGAHWRRISVAGSLIAFAITSLLMWVSFDQTLKSTQRIAAVQLSRDLRKEFRERDICNPLLKRIGKCQPNWRENGGPFDYQKINNCLNFLDDVGYYVALGGIDLDTADHLFGAAVIELTLDPELKDYMAGIGVHEEGGFSSLITLSQSLQALPRHAKLIRHLEQTCLDPDTVNGDSR